MDNELYKQMFEKCHAVVLVIDPGTGKIIEANNSACDYYGYSKKQLKRKRIQEINMLSEDEVFAEMQKAKNESRNYFNFKHQLANGEIKDVEVFSGPITIGDKTVLYSIINDISERINIEKEKEDLILKLEETLSHVRLLSGLLPICASCKSIRDDKGYWKQIESYIRDHSEAEFSHGICPECAKKLYPDLYQ